MNNRANEHQSNARLTLTIEFATGRRGPVRSLFDGLRRLGFGERMVKTALAAFLAWELGRLIPGNPHPYLAPLTAILVMQATIAQSMTYAIQRGIGVAIGVIVALITVETVGVHGWTIGFVVLISLSVGARLGSGAQSTQQIAVTALLVMLLGSAADEFTYAGLRITDTIVGTAVALSLNALFAPPSYLPTAQLAVGALGEQVALTLEKITTSLREGMTKSRGNENLERARSVGATLDRMESAIAQAQMSLKYHPFASTERDQLAALHEVGAALERVSIQIRVIARTILEDKRRELPGDEQWIAPGLMGIPLATLIESCAHAVRALAENVQPGCEGRQLNIAVAQARSHRAAADAAAQNTLDAGLPKDWATTGEILAVASRLLSELDIASMGELEREDDDPSSFPILD